MSETKKRIIFVEDEGHLSFFVRQALSEEYDIDIARTGEEAIKRWEESPYHLIVTDIRLPRMSGLELIAQLQTKFPNVKAIIVTAYDSPEMREKIKEIPGIVAFLPKPFSVEKLKNIIKEALSS